MSIKEFVNKHCISCNKKCNTGIIVTNQNLRCFEKNITEKRQNFKK